MHERGCYYVLKLIELLRTCYDVFWIQKIQVKASNYLCLIFTYCEIWCGVTSNCTDFMVHCVVHLTGTIFKSIHESTHDKVEVHETWGEVFEDGSLFDIIIYIFIVIYIVSNCPSGIDGCKFLHYQIAVGSNPEEFNFINSPILIV